MKNAENILKIFEDSKTIINGDLLLIIYNLLKYIIIKKEKQNEKSNIQNHLELLIPIINENIIKDEDKYINTEYSITNFKNIIEFIKFQNKKFSGEILEGLLIYIFSFAFETSQDNTFGKNIFNNIFKLKDAKNYELVNMFKKDKFEPEELKDIKEILDKDGTVEDKINERINDLQRNSVIYNLLFQIFYEKYINIKIIDKKNNYSMNFINRGFSDNQKISFEIFDKLRDNSSTALDRDVTGNSIMSLIVNLYFPNEFGKVSRAPIRLIRAFLIQVYIYWQNKNSPLMNYITTKVNNEIIPFVYDLKGACVEGRFASIIIGPTRIEPRINKILISQNNLRESGLYEIGRAIIFNKNVKIIDCNTSLFRNNYLEYLNRALGLFDNYSVEELNLSFNYLKEFSEDYLAKLITHFKGLKTLNLTMNEFKKGISSFLFVLKNLYRKGETKLEVLYLNKCLLDEGSFYELGELLKCKYCKLKKLYINNNVLPSNINFLKKLKKNKSLTEIYLSREEIGKNQVNDIARVISNTEIHYLYLYRNKIINFNGLIELLYRTKIVNDSNEINNNTIISEDSFLINLDLSNNEPYIKNEFHIKLISKLINQTTLYCIDFSHIIFGPNPDKYKLDNNTYRKNVENLKKQIAKDKTNYIEEKSQIRPNKVEIKKYMKFREEEKIYDLDDKIMEILNNPKAKYTVYLREEARKLINDNNTEIRNIFINNNIIDKKEYRNIENKLVQYMKFKRTNKVLEHLEETNKNRKLILI